MVQQPCTHSDSWGILGLALPLQWEGFCSLGPCNEVQGHDRHGRPDCQWRPRPELSQCVLKPVLLSNLSEGVLCLSLLINLSKKSLLVIFHNPCQNQFHLCLDFPDLSAACLNSISVFFSSHPPLLPLSVHFLLFPQFKLQVLAQPCQFPASSARFLILDDGELSSLQKIVLKEFPAWLCSFVLLDSFPSTN